MKKETKNNQKIVQYNHKDNISKFSFEYYKEYFKEKFSSRHLFLVLMLTKNGKYTLFTVTTKEDYFDYKGKQYFIDSDTATYNFHAEKSMLFYHEDCSTPFKISIDIDKLNEKLAAIDDSIILAINPRSLKGFIKSQVIEKILKGEELTDDMAFMKKLIIINLLISGIVLVVIAKSMGWI